MLSRDALTRASVLGRPQVLGKADAPLNGSPKRQQGGGRRRGPLLEETWRARPEGGGGASMMAQTRTAGATGGCRARPREQDVRKNVKE